MLTPYECTHKEKLSDLWHEYVDIFECLEELFDSLHHVYQNIEIKLDDLSDNFDNVKKRLSHIPSYLLCFDTPDDSSVRSVSYVDTTPQDTLGNTSDEQLMLPFRWDLAHEGKQ